MRPPAGALPRPLLAAASGALDPSLARLPCSAGGLPRAAVSPPRGVLATPGGALDPSPARPLAAGGGRKRAAASPPPGVLAAGGVLESSVSCLPLPKGCLRRAAASSSRGAIAAPGGALDPSPAPALAAGGGRKRAAVSSSRGAIAAAALGGLAGWWLLQALDHDRVAALAAGLLLSVALAVCAGPLRLSPLSPALLYLGVFGLFHLGLVVPWALGLHTRSLPPWFLANRLSPALSLVVLAVGCYLAGVIWATRLAAPPPETTLYTSPPLYRSGVAIYLAGAAMFALGVWSLGGARFFESGYAETYRLTAQFDPRLFGASFTVVPIGLYLAAAAGPRSSHRTVWALTALWVGGIFYLGFRGYALIPGLVTLALLRQRGRRIPRWLAAALVALALAAIPAARAVRDVGVGRRSFDRVAGRVHPLEGIVEMGGSLRPLVQSITYLESEPWRWGRTYWQSLRTIVPNLAARWEGAPYIPLDELPPNHWFTAQAEPQMYLQYGGLGFSAVAEPYMNFGIPGVALYFLALGAALGRGFRSRRPLSLALWAMILGPLLWTTRNSFEIFFRPAVWGVAAVWLSALAGRVLSYAPPAPQVFDARTHCQ